MAQVININDYLDRRPKPLRGLSRSQVVVHIEFRPRNAAAYVPVVSFLLFGFFLFLCFTPYAGERS